MTEQARGPREPLLAAAERPQPAPLAGGGKRPISLVTREELRDLNREVSGAGRGGGGGRTTCLPCDVPTLYSLMFAETEKTGGRAARQTAGGAAAVLGWR